ncbi:CgeB family protein [Geomonas diazotrophica]|nr:MULTISPECIES: hypothetical protein [Geomonas]
MAAPLTIAFFASSLVSAYWNGAATYYRGMVRALSRLGHRITFYEPDAHFPVPPEPRFQADLSFLGNRLPDREHRVEEFFLSHTYAHRARQFQEIFACGPIRRAYIGGAP